MVDRTGDTYDATGAVPEVTAAPLHGSAAFDGDTLTYTPDSGYVGTDQFGLQGRRCRRRRQQHRHRDRDRRSRDHHHGGRCRPGRRRRLGDRRPGWLRRHRRPLERQRSGRRRHGDDRSGRGRPLARHRDAHRRQDPLSPDRRVPRIGLLHLSDQRRQRRHQRPGHGVVSRSPRTAIRSPVPTRRTSRRTARSTSMSWATTTIRMTPCCRSLRCRLPSHGTASVVSGKVRYIPVGELQRPGHVHLQGQRRPRRPEYGDDRHRHGRLDERSADRGRTTPHRWPRTARSTSTCAGTTTMSTATPCRSRTSRIRRTAPRASRAARSATNPDANYDGADSFTYTACDGSRDEQHRRRSRHGARRSNDAPVADGRRLHRSRGCAATSVLVLAGDTDVDGDAAHDRRQDERHARDRRDHRRRDGPRPIDRIPNYSGDDTFTYTITDGHAHDTATVTVHVGGANDPPIAGTDDSTWPRVPTRPSSTSSTTTTTPTATRSIVFSQTAALHGTVTITGNGTGLTYNPTGNYSGSDKFKYTITDGNGEFSTATVLVTVVRRHTADGLDRPASGSPGRPSRARARSCGSAGAARTRARGSRSTSSR